MIAGRQRDGQARGVAAVALGPPPPEVVASARSAFRARDTESVLAQVVTDSLDEPAINAMERRVRFSGGGLELVVSVRHAAAGHSSELLMDVLAPQTDSVEVQSHGRMPMRADVVGKGRWAVRPVPAGPVRITVVSRDDVKVRTEWTRW